MGDKWLAAPGRRLMGLRQVLLIGLLLVPLTGAAQEGPVLEHGVQVRIKAPTLRRTLFGSPVWIKGVIIVLKADTLVIKAEVNEKRVLPIEAVTQWEVNVPSTSRWVQGAPPLSATMVVLASQRGQIALPARPVPLIGPGSRVRMIVPSTWKGRTAGTVVSLDTDTLVVATRSKGSRYVDRIPLNAVTKLEVRRAQASHGENALEGAGVGLLAGGLIGLGLGSIIDINSGGYDLLTREETMLFFGTVLGLSGSLLGAAMGATDERWEPVRLPLSVSFSPHGGARVTLRFEFGR